MSDARNAGRACLAGLILLLAAHTACNVWWLWRDNHPVIADEALHMQFAESFYAALFEPGDMSLSERLAAAASIETIYPPLLHIIGAALWLFLPYSGEALAFASTLAFLALLAGVYALTAAFLSPQRALLAAVLVGFTPFLFGASRLFIQDVLAAAFVVWTIYAAHRTMGFQRTGWVIAFALLAGFGLLARWTTPLYYAFPVLLLLAEGARPSLRDPVQRKPALLRIGLHAGLLAGLALALAVPWYWQRLETLQSGYQSVFAGRQGSFDWTSFQDWTFYLVYIINTGTFLPLFLLACAGFVVMLWRREERFAGAMLLLWAAAAYLLLTLTWSIKSPAPRYIIPFLPVFGIAAAAALAAVPRGRWRMVGAAAAVAFFTLHFVNLTFTPVHPVHRFEAPIFADHPAVQSLGQGGLVVVRERVRASAARYFAAYQGENWQRRVFRIMQNADHERQIGGRHRLQYGLLRLPKVGLERRQSYYTPDYGEDVPDNIHAIPQAFEPLNPLAPHDWPDTATANDGLEAWFSEPTYVTAYSVTFEDDDAALVRFVPMYWQPSQQRWRSFRNTATPAVVDGLSHFQRTSSVLTRGVRLQPTRAALEPRVTDVTFYGSTYYERPIALVAEGETLADITEDLVGVEYLVVAGLQQREMSALRDDFFVIERFSAHLGGFWDPTEITVLGRRDLLPN